MYISMCIHLSDYLQPVDMPFGSTITSNRVLLPRQLAFGPGSSVPEAQKCQKISQALGNIQEYRKSVLNCDYYGKKQVGIELCITFNAAKLILLHQCRFIVALRWWPQESPLSCPSRSDMCRDIFHALFEAVALGEGMFWWFLCFGCIANHRLVPCRCHWHRKAGENHPNLGNRGSGGKKPITSWYPKYWLSCLVQTYCLLMGQRSKKSPRLCVEIIEVHHGFSQNMPFTFYPSFNIHLPARFLTTVPFITTGGQPPDGLLIMDQAIEARFRCGRWLAINGKQVEINRNQ